MRSLLCKLLLKFQGTHLHSSVTITGFRGIQIGTGCIIRPYVYLKATPSSRLIVEDNVVVERYSHLSSKGQILRIGQNSYVGYNNWIGGQGNIIIEENFMSGMNVVIISSNHDYHQITVPYIAGPEIADTIRVGKNVWIGANAVILPGVEIGEGSVVSAGSVVTSDVPKNAIVAGNPAKVVRIIEHPEK